MVIPVLDNVLIKVDAEDRAQGNLLLVYGEKVLKNSGFVQAVGGSDVIKVKVGDHVLFEKGMGRRFDVPAVREECGVKYTEYESYILIGYFDILAVLED
jgi:co-chaperonin GroES (HSP10)